MGGVQGNSANQEGIAPSIPVLIAMFVCYIFRKLGVNI